MKFVSIVYVVYQILVCFAAPCSAQSNNSNIASVFDLTKYPQYLPRLDGNGSAIWQVSYIGDSILPMLGGTDIYTTPHKQGVYVQLRSKTDGALIFDALICTGNVVALGSIVQADSLLIISINFQDSIHVQGVSYFSNLGISDDILLAIAQDGTVIWQKQVGSNKSDFISMLRYNAITRKLNASLTLDFGKSTSQPSISTYTDVYDSTDFTITAQSGTEQNFLLTIEPSTGALLWSRPLQVRTLGTYFRVFPTGDSLLLDGKFESPTFTYNGVNYNFDHVGTVSGGPAACLMLDSNLAVYNTIGIQAFASGGPTFQPFANYGFNLLSNREINTVGKFSNMKLKVFGQGWIYSGSDLREDDVYVARFKPSGLLKWRLVYGCAVGDAIRDFNYDNIGGMLLTGSFGDTVTLPSGHFANAGGYMMYVDSSGIIKMLKQADSGNIHFTHVVELNSQETKCLAKVTSICYMDGHVLQPGWYLLTFKDWVLQNASATVNPIKIFPNPAQRQVQCNTAITQAILVDASGKAVQLSYTNTQNSALIDLPPCSAGNYFINISTQEDEKYSTQIQINQN
jgi:hypothetical protein